MTDLTEGNEKVSIRSFIYDLQKLKKKLTNMKLSDDYYDRQRDIAEKYINRAIGELNEALK